METDAAVTIGTIFVMLCVSPLLTGWIAERKGRRALPWALFGVLGGVLASARRAGARARAQSAATTDTARIAIASRTQTTAQTTTNNHPSGTCLMRE